MIKGVIGRGEQALASGTNPARKNIEARWDTDDEVMSSLLVQIADLSRHLKVIEKK
jgi:hypothetical protein